MSLRKRLLGNELTYRFLFLVVVIATSITMLYPIDEKLKLGIDLRGGYSLIYEINTAELPADTDVRAITQQTIATLKRRIDPEGQRNIIMRQLGANRIEVQMAAPPASLERDRQGYLDALDRVAAGNADLDKIAEAIQQAVDLESLRKQLAGFAGPDPLRLPLLEAAADAGIQERATRIVLANLREELNAKTAALAEAQARLDQLVAQRDAQPEAVGPALPPAPTTAPEAGTQPAAEPTLDEQIQQLTEQVLALSTQIRTANVAVEETRGELAARTEALARAFEALDERNVSISRLTRVLERPFERAPTAQIEARRAALEVILTQHPQQADAIRAADEVYRSWRGNKGSSLDVEDLKRLVRGAGQLDFRILPLLGEDLQQEEAISLIDRLTSGGPRSVTAQYVWLAIENPEDFVRQGLLVGQFEEQLYVLAWNQAGKMLLHDNAQPWKLERAVPSFDPQQGYVVLFELDPPGGLLFQNLTSRNLQKPLCIILDGRAISAPNLRDAISRNGQISGSFSPDDAQFLATTLAAGSLKARLKDTPISERTVGSQLGETNQREGINSILIGIALVLGFMLVYYRLSGAFANVALVLNLLFILACMAQFDATFTLPGLAGLVLTLAIAVDANVLINERIREEQDKGLSTPAAVSTGYGRVFWTIFDANLTTVITGFILYYFGSEEIRSFAIALLYGIFISMFTALWVTRQFFHLAFSLGWIERVGMLRLIGTPTIDWVGKLKFFLPVSALIILSSLVLFVHVLVTPDERSRVLDIEFIGGTGAQIDLRPGTDGQPQMNDAGVRREIEQLAANFRGPWSNALATSTVVRSSELVENRFEVRLGAGLPSAAVGADLIHAALPDVVRIDRTQIISPNVLQVELLSAGDQDGFRQQLVLAAEMIRAAGSELVGASVQRVGDDGLSYEIITTVKNRQLLVTGIEDQLGDRLRKREALSFTLGDPLPILSDQFLLSQVVSQAPPRSIRAFAGGAVLVLDDIEPPQSTEVLFERLRNARLAGDAVQASWRDFQVIGLEEAGQGSDGQPRFRRASVLVREDDADYETSEARWAGMVEEERSLINLTLRKREPLSKVTNFDPQIAASAQTQAAVSILLAFLAVAAYVWLRFGSLNFGLGALLAVVHDVVIAVGVVSILAFAPDVFPGMRINLVVVGAFLTVIGYSINDTIVIFDRIRETRGRSDTPLTRDLINKAINQTLGRTLVTSLTTILVLLVLLFAGGTGLQGFSVALLIGILTGTYSSIAIASPLLLVGQRIEKKRKGRRRAASEAPAVASAAG